VDLLKPSLWDEFLDFCRFEWVRAVLLVQVVVCA